MSPQPNPDPKSCNPEYGGDGVGGGVGDGLYGAEPDPIDASSKVLPKKASLLATSEAKAIAAKLSVTRIIMTWRCVREKYV